MKLAKRTLALLMCAIMLVTSCIIVSAGAEDKATISVTGTVDVNEAVSYEKLSITSGQNGNTLTAVGLEFDPDDGYIPMVFSGYSGTSAVLKTQYNIATFGVSGYIADGGLSISDVDARNKVDKVTAAVTGNIVTFGASGAIVDSGYTVASDSDIAAMLTSVFGTVSGGGEG